MERKDERNYECIIYQHIYLIHELDNKSKSMSREKTEINHISLIRAVYDEYIQIVLMSGPLTLTRIANEEKRGRTGMEHMKKVRKNSKKVKNGHTGISLRDNKQTPVLSKVKDVLRDKNKDNDISVKNDTSEKEITNADQTGFRKDRENKKIKAQNDINKTESNCSESYTNRQESKQLPSVTKNRDNSKNGYKTVSNVTIKITVDEQKAPKLSEDHMKKIQIKEKNCPVNDNCRHRNRQQGRLVSMNNSKAKRHDVKTSTQNKERIEEIATKIAIDEQKVSKLSEDRMKKIQIKEKNCPVNDNCRHRNRPHGRFVSKNNSKDKRHDVKTSTQNKEIIEEMATKIAVDEQKATKLSMDHMKKKQIKEKNCTVNDNCRHRKRQQGRVDSMNYLKNIRAVVKISTQNKELIREIARSFFENYKFAPLERSTDSINISHTKDGYSLELIVPTNTGGDTDLSNYCNRLITFCDWPLDAPVSALRLAAAGFYYCKQGTQVECFSCGLSLSDWSPPNNNPQIRHEQLVPLCLFINSNKEGSATGGSEYRLEFPTQNTELNDVTKSNPEENVYESSAVFNEAVDIVNSNTETISSSSCLEEDNADARQNIAYDHMDIQRGENASQRGLPINQAVDNISTQEIENIPPTLQADTASNQNVMDNSIRQESGRFAHLNEVDYSHLDYQNFAMAKHPQYASPTRRLETFRSWSYHNVQHPERLVEAGFYYTDSTDVVRCYHCDIGLAEWAVEDDPWVEHARHSPQCYYLRDKQGMDFIDNVQRSWREIYTPKCPQFEDFHVRRSTFQGWPSDRDQSPRDLAAAGFYYTGEDDTVRCHYCDGGLRQWEPGDNPWVEHARWFPFCKYLIKMKGLPFIEEVAMTYNELYVDNIESSAETFGAYGIDDFDNENTSTDAKRNALSMAASVSFLEMGYRKDTLMMTINEYLKRTGNREFTTEDLFSVLTEINDDELPKDDDTDNSLSEIALQDIPRINAEELNNEELRKVNRQIKNKVFLCKTCKVKERNMIFIPCGHRETCELCAKNTMICFTCGDFINKRVKTFLS